MSTYIPRIVSLVPPIKTEADPMHYYFPKNFSLESCIKFCTNSSDWSPISLFSITESRVSNQRPI